MRPFKHPAVNYFVLERVLYALMHPVRWEIVRHSGRGYPRQAAASWTATAEIEHMSHIHSGYCVIAERWFIDSACVGHHA